MDPIGQVKKKQKLTVSDPEVARICLSLDFQTSVAAMWK